MNSVQVIGAMVQYNYLNFDLTLSLSTLANLSVWGDILTRCLQRWAIWLMYVATLVLSAILSFSQKPLPWIATVGGVVTLGGGIAWTAAFLALSPKQPASFVFTTFINA